MVGTIEINGTGGIIEGDLGAANVDVNLEPAPRFDETASATTNSYITGADINDMEVATYSIMCWFKPIPSNGSQQNDSTGWLIGKDNTVQMGFHNTTGTVRCYSRPDGSWSTLTTSTTDCRNSWHHACFTWDGSNNKLYIDGKLEATVAASGAAAAGNSNKFMFGAKGQDDDQYEGYIKDVKLYSAVLDATAIGIAAQKINTDINLIGNVSDCEAWYKFDDSTDSTPEDSTTNNNDCTGTGADVTWVHDAFSVNVHDATRTTGVDSGENGTASTTTGTYLAVGDATTFATKYIGSDTSGNADFFIMINNEKMKVNYINVSTNNLTVVRGALGTTAATHSNADIYYADGTQTSGTFTVTQGKVEGLSLTCLDFEAGDSADRVEVTHDTSGFSSVSVSAWVNFETLDDAYRGIVQCSDDQSWNDGFGLTLTEAGSGKLGFWVDAFSDAAEVDISTLSTSRWYHLVGTFDSTTGIQSLYIDGVLKDTNSDTWSNKAASGSKIKIGCGVAASNGNDFWFDGKIRDVRIYKDFTLTADQVASLYSGSYPVAPLLAYKFDEASGNAQSWGTASGATGDVNGANRDTTGTLHLNYDLVIAANGTMSAPRGQLDLGRNLQNDGTYTHNNGTLRAISVDNTFINTTGAVDPIFYNVQNTAYELRFYKDTTIIRQLELDAASTHCYIWGNKTLTMGTATNPETNYPKLINNMNTGDKDFFFYAGDGQTATLAGVLETHPIRITNTNSSDFEWGYHANANAQIKNCDFQFDIETDASNDRIKLTGACEFDKLSLGSGDVLDLNGQRAEFGGMLASTSTGTIDAENSLIIFKGKTSGFNCRIFDDATFTSTGSTVIVDDDSPLLQIQSGISFNNLMFRGTNDAIDNDIVTTGNVYFTGTDFPSTNSKNWTIGGDLVVATDSELDGQSSDFYVARDFVASGGIIGDSAYVFNGAASGGGFINCGSDSSIANIFDGGGTAEAWIKIDGDAGTASGMRPFSKDKWFISVDNDASGDVYKLRLYQFFSGDNGIWSSTDTVLSKDKWHHIAITYDNGAITNDPIMYVDGKQVTITETGTPTVGSGSGRDTDASDTLYIGNRADGARTFNGAIGMARLFTDIRTAAELRADMFSSSFSDSTCDVTGGGENTVTCDANTNIKVGQEVHGDSGTVFIPAATTVASITEAGGAGTGVTSFELSGSGSTETHTNVTLKFNRMANVGNLVLFYQFDEGTGTYVKDRSQGPTTVRGTITANSSAWAGRGNFHEETSTVFMNASYGTQNIKFISGIWFNNLYIENGSTTNLYTIGTTGGNTNHKGDLVVHGTFQTHSSSPSNSIALRNPGDKMFFPQALTFDGSDDFITCGTDSSLDITSAITCSAWVRVESGNVDTMFIICKNDDGSDKAYNLVTTETQVQFSIYDGGVEKRAISTTAVNDGKWHHITGTYDGSTVKVYVDAVVGGTTISHSGDIDSKASEPVFLGQRGNGNRRLKGDLADVRIYSRALSATEITTLKSQILPNDAPTADLVSHWKLNEVGSSTTTTATDSVGSNNGTLTNFVSSPWFGNKATAVVGINHWETVLNNSGAVSLDLPSCTMKSFRDYFSTDSVVAKGDMTFTTELQIDAGTTFNANGNTIYSQKAVDCNSTGTFNLKNSTLKFTSNSGDYIMLDDTFNILTSNTTIEGYGTGNDRSTFYTPANGNFEVVGNVKWLKIESQHATQAGDLTVVGSVTDCSYATENDNIRQWLHTLDTQQLLDADEKGDDDMKLPRPSLDNAHQLQTGG